MQDKEGKAHHVGQLHLKTMQLETTIKQLQGKVRKSQNGHDVATVDQNVAGAADMHVDACASDPVHGLAAVPAAVHGHGQAGKVAQWQYWRGARWLYFQDDWWVYYAGEWWRQALCWLRWQPDPVQWA